MLHFGVLRFVRSVVNCTDLIIQYHFLFLEICRSAMDFMKVFDQTVREMLAS